jgi:hypothetical protein
MLIHRAAAKLHRIYRLHAAGGDHHNAVELTKKA